MAERALSGPLPLAVLFARAGLSMLPGAARLPFVGGGGGEMPNDALGVSDVAIDRGRLAAYDRVCGFDVSDVLPATYPHVLAFPLQLALMTSGAFPVPVVGLVHIHDRIVAHRPIDAGERLSLRVWSTPLQPHPRGETFTLRTEARVGSELVWEEAATNLARGPGDASAEASQDVPEAEGLPMTARWRLRGGLGRRYGAVSGDINPIHVHPLSARLFGFPSAIAHGMWTAARCLAALSPGLPEAFAVEVAFRRPILLPATVRFAEAPAPGGTGGIAFGVRSESDGTPHLDGLLTPVAR